MRGKETMFTHQTPRKGGAYTSRATDEEAFCSSSSSYRTLDRRSTKNSRKKSETHQIGGACESRATA